VGRYIIRRLLQLIPVFIGTTFLIFALVFAIPGDPIRALAGDRPLPPAVQEELRDRYNLNDPLVVQYGKYMVGLLQGDFGEDFRGRPVSDIMAERWPITIQLALMAFAVEVVIGIAAGILAGLRRGSFLDNLVRISTVVVISIPIFVLGFTAQILFGVRWPIFPVAYNGTFYSLILPALVLASTSLAYIARLTRTTLAENLRADYVRTAVAKGLSRLRVIGVHTLRNSLIPVVTFLGVDLGALMGGAVVTEGIFNVPGVGNQLYRSILAQESTVVVGIVTALVLVYLFANLIVDLLYAVLDPRIRYD
jgi:oligopeptide transport system permease protein